MDELLATFRWYVDRIDHVVSRIEDTCPAAFDAVPWPGTFPAGRQLGVALFFAARGPVKAAGRPMPEFPGSFAPEHLHELATYLREALAGITAADLMQSVAHKAGFAEIEQDTGDYLARFALPNMIFHFSMGYAAARAGGADLGKADFDGQHEYPKDFSF